MPKVKTILISLVSNNDEKGNGSIIKLVKQQKTDIVILFYGKPDSKNNWEDIAVENKIYMEQHEECYVPGNSKGLSVPPEVFLQMLDLDNPYSHEEVWRLMSEEINVKLEEVVKDALAVDASLRFNLLVNLTSGTPQQTDILCSSILGHKIPKHIPSVAVADEDVWEDVQMYRAARDKEEVRKVDMPFFEEISLLRSLDDFADTYNFNALQSACEKIGYHRYGNERKIADVFKNVFEAAELIDQRHLDLVIQKLNSILNKLRKLNSDLKRKQMQTDLAAFQEWIEAFKSYIQLYCKSLSLCNDKETKEALTELYWDLYRNAQRGNYIEVMNRLYRLTEGVIYYVLWNEFSVTRNGKVEGIIDENLKNEYINIINSIPRKNKNSFLCYENGARVLCKLLANHNTELHDILLKELGKIGKQRGDLSSLIQVRHTSPAEHAMSPVSRFDSDGAVQFASLLIMMIYPEKLPHAASSISDWYISSLERSGKVQGIFELLNSTVFQEKCSDMSDTVKSLIGVHPLDSEKAKRILRQYIYRK